MTELKNVIEHLQIIRTWAELGGKRGRGMEPECCLQIAAWMDEALDVLNEQKPRVLTYNELATFDGAFLMESPTVADLDWVFFFDIDTKSDAIWVADFDGERGIIYREDYGTYVRCWTSRPSDKQREAVQWNG